MPKTVRFYTLGCKVNQYDSEAMLEAFLASGYSLAPHQAPADVYVVNTCTVTGTGDQKSMQAARRFKRQNPNGELVLAGCLAQRVGDKLRETGARLIIGTQYRGKVVALLEQAIEQQTQLVAVDSLSSVPFEPLTIHAHAGHTRAVMKIQEGCDCRCTYCIIPSVRGSVRSKPVAQVRAEAQALADAGFTELVLTGIHLTSYGKDLGYVTLADAIQAVHAVEGVMRIRLGSLEPAAITQPFVNALKDLPKLCPQFHLALQSGSDTVLARMKRRYNTTQFREAAERISAAWPLAAFTTDVIVGFPGETEVEFAQTMAFCAEIGFMRLHVFPFSPREGTPAAEMDGQISQSVKETRVHALIQVGESLAALYYRRLLGTVQPVLVEECLAEHEWRGYTPQYVQVICRGSTAEKIVPVRLTAIDKEGMSGDIVEPYQQKG